MTAEIKDCVSKCETCNTYQTNQQKEPLIPHDPPKRPWSHVATDLFSFDNKEWFIIVDHWSDYFELNQLSSTNSSSVIKSLKNQFARHGIPDTLYSDNGPQFASREFKEFASAWHFDHQTSSPHYPQSNGKIENAVKTAKKLLTKAKASGQDPYLAILDWRNTPSPVLDHHQYKDCLDDAQRHCYLQQELCYSQRSWRELKTSSKKERRNEHCFTTKEQKSFLSFNLETQCA